MSGPLFDDRPTCRDTVLPFVSFGDTLTPTNMASVWKRQSDRRKPGAPWYITYRDEHGNRRTIRGYTDKRATEQLAAQLEDEARKRRDGLIDEAQEQLAAHAKRPLSAHLDEYEQHLLDKGSTKRHVRETMAYIRDAADSLGWGRVRDIRAEAAHRHLADRRTTRGTGARALNARRTALRGFTRWLIAHGRLAVDPLAALPAFKEAGDRRRVRRTLSPEDLARLVEHTERAPTLGRLAGTDRAMLYRVLAGTGLRRSEASSLTADSFHLDDPDGPHVVVEAAYSKRRRRDEQPLPHDLAAVLAPWLAGRRGESGALWPLPDKAYAKVLRPDLERAGIAATDEEGRVFDFHSFRHGYCSALARAGVPVKAMMDLARHSDPRLTLATYAKLELADRRGALEAAFGSVDPQRAAHAQRAEHTEGHREAS